MISLSQSLMYFLSALIKQTTEKNIDHLLNFSITLSYLGDAEEIKLGSS